MNHSRGLLKLVLICVLIGTAVSVYETEEWIAEFCSEIEDNGEECDRETRAVAELAYFYHIPYTAVLFGFYGFAVASVFYLYRVFLEAESVSDSEILNEDE